ncbi:glycosyl hydrolase family 28-related protein [Occultella aeris]|uniref:Pectate lyase superfamily protein n=1 Tax=Occultella aeris TaxID=2761496 RepID=A0A7M4DH21_9MICO|nr:glycosyl hydrolase family 28-related protein [Occultella aeris]VZO36214.1 Pectate lyase superfamily protein [Occultella aeris]
MRHRATRGLLGTATRRLLAAATAGALAVTLAAGATAGAAPAAAAPEPDLADPVGPSVYASMPQDPLAVVLGSPGFPVHGDGVGDDTAVIQAAINEASRRGGENWLGNIVGGARGVEVGDGGGLVFVPEGTYRISGRINLHASVRLIGFGASRPQFYVAPGTPGFDGDPEFVFAATRRPYVPDAPVTFGNNDTFGTGLVNVNIVVAEHNPGAIGVRFGGAQMFLLQDVGISLADGYAGIDHNANLLQRVTVRGGQFGMLAFAATPGWQTTVLDSSFSGQEVAAIRLHTDAKLSIVRTRFADAAAGIETIPASSQRLVIEDSLFERIAGPVITLNDSASLPATSEPELVQAQNQLNVLNTGVIDSGPLLRTLPSATTWTSPHAGYRVDEATLGLRVTDALGDGESRSTDVLLDATRAPAAVLERVLRSDIALPPATTDWVNIAEYAAEHGVSVGSGTEDDMAIFQQALDEHDTVYVPMGAYLLTDTLRLGPSNNLIGLHPRQTWLTIPDGSDAFADPDDPRAIVQTPPGGRNTVSGLGLDTAPVNPGSVHVRWQAGAHSQLSDVVTQFVKWAPEETRPGDPAPGDPGYGHRGVGRYNFWVDGGGGSFLNLWAVAGWADNGLLVENTSVPGRVYEISVEHHRYREVVLRDVRNWVLRAVQTEDHIYGWESQAVELERVRDVTFTNTVFFRVATVLGPYPYAVGIVDSTGVVIRGTRGYRPDNVANTRWGATIADVGSGRSVPELEVAYLGVGEPGAGARRAGLRVGLDDASLRLLPGERAETLLTIATLDPAPLHDVQLAIEGTDDLDVALGPAPARLLRGDLAGVPVTVSASATAADGTRSLVATLTFTAQGTRTVVEVPITVRVGTDNLALGAPVTASSVLSGNVATNAVDGSVSGGRWVSGTGDPQPTLTIDLGAPADLHEAVIHSGVAGSDALRVHTVEVDALIDGAWQLIGRVEGNGASPVRVPLEAGESVREVRLRFTRPSASDGVARVFEVAVLGTR